MSEQGFAAVRIPDFDRRFFESSRAMSRIGKGEIGGKAHGLAIIHDALEAVRCQDCFQKIDVSIPRFAVLATDVFDAFMKQNDLYEIALSEEPDSRIAHAFQQARMPTPILGDLQALVEHVHQPLAVRSSSLLEDALFRPFAGVYGTKMTPNNQPDAQKRFQRLCEAIKYIWASTFFKDARDYIRATDQEIRDEKMAVIIQEVVGERLGDRFYPQLSGVGRSFNFYPSGRARPEEGVVNLALGLGMTIVDGGVSWAYSPMQPKAPPPFGSVQALLQATQSDFWAIDMAKLVEHNPLKEREYLQHCSLADAEFDGALRYVASTYTAESDRLVPGIGPTGPRALNFAPLLVLREYPLNEAVKDLLRLGEETLGKAVEIEFAMTFPHGHQEQRPRLGFLQVRPMVVSEAQVEIADSEMDSPTALVASEHVMGNGEVDRIQDIIYVKPDLFEPQNTPRIAAELDKLNTGLLKKNRPYLLIGFGRWGSSDPWLGIPVGWGAICGAKAIVEASLPNMMVDPSQGSHFFHNITSFHVSYFTVPHGSQRPVNWEWLRRQPIEQEGEFVTHVRLAHPLRLRVDGRCGRGVILTGDESAP
ncbi:MAG: PEP/pyruvate-binding domain-containing protein [Phycisphaerales bacterium JB038]